MSGIISWLFSVVLAGFAISIVANLASPFVKDWLANLSATRARARMDELAYERAEVVRLTSSPEYLQRWALMEVFTTLLRLVLMFGEAFLTAGILLFARTWEVGPLPLSDTWLLLFFGAALTGIGISLLYGVVPLMRAQYLLRSVRRGDRYLSDIDRKLQHFSERAQRAQ